MMREIVIPLPLRLPLFGDNFKRPKLSSRDDNDDYDILG